MQHNPNYTRPKDVTTKHEAILNSIDETLGAYDTQPIIIGAEHFRALEETKIVEMVGSIGLWQTEGQAFDAYMLWKSGYSIVQDGTV